MKLLHITLLLSLLTTSAISETIHTIGASPIKPTDKKLGTIYISTTGKGHECSLANPCNISILIGTQKHRKIQPGDVIFFRSGIYKYNMKKLKRLYLKGGTKNKPVIYESYPGELAIFDGSVLNVKDKEKLEWREGRLQLRGNYIKLRNIKVRNMPQYGIRIFGNHNTIEGCIVHNNHLSGIEILNHRDSNLSSTSGGSFNTIQNNIIYNNSDVGLSYGNYNLGGNADGITIHSGVNNTLKNNTIYNNSDDGIDTYKSLNTVVSNNLIYNHGYGKHGNANGIKVIGDNAIIKHNILYNNNGFGITVHSKNNNAILKYNTAYANKKAGYAILDDTQLLHNLSYANLHGDYKWSQGKKQINNSWQKRNPLFYFENFSHTSSHFLRPTNSSNLKDIGAYAKEYVK